MTETLKAIPHEAKQVPRLSTTKYNSDSDVSRGVFRVLEHLPKVQRYIKELLRYLSLYQQVLVQTII